MDPGPIRDALTLVAGVATGMLSGAFGVGGAVVSTPAIRLLGASAFIAVGTTLPSILPSAATGTARYAKADLIRWRVVGWTTPAGMVSAVGGSLLTRVIPGHGHLLMIATAALLGFTALRMAKGRDPEPPDPADLAEVDEEKAAVAARAAADAAKHRQRPSVLLGVGAAAGLMSGLLGIGGGTVMVPGFTEIAGIPLKTAIATSLACVGIFAIPSTVTHALLGDIDWRFALLLTVGVIPGARLGAAAAIRATDRRMRIAVAIFLSTIALIYAAGEIAALFG
ncbi:MAG: uncharacterized protein QOI20_219 [Acidimicrobiaceae bacterium]|nr:uncharacterized protein [Acidimicrobiaceae bacterium]